MEASAAEVLPENQAGVEICTRCGSFAELAPFWGTRLCPACIERKASSFRGPTTVRGLLAGIAAFPLRLWVTAVLVHLVFDIPSLLRTLLGANTTSGLGLDILLSSIAASLVTYMGVQVGLGQPASPLSAVRVFGMRAGPWFRATLLSGVWVAALGILLVVPGVLKSLALALTAPIVLFEPTRPAMEVLDKSAERMRGVRLAAFLSYSLFGGMGLLVGVIAAVLGEESASFGARALAAAGDGLSVVLSAPTTLITAVLYLRRTPFDALPIARSE
jgi:hypothetical protein